jgi:hypothetical protein
MRRPSIKIQESGNSRLLYASVISRDSTIIVAERHTPRPATIRVGDLYHECAGSCARVSRQSTRQVRRNRRPKHEPPAEMMGPINGRPPRVRSNPITNVSASGPSGAPIARERLEELARIKWFSRIEVRTRHEVKKTAFQLESRPANATIVTP